MLSSKKQLTNLYFKSTRYFSTFVKKNIGFIGLGNMGLPMVSNLLKHGHQVTVYDINSKKMEKAASEGAIPAENVGVLSKNQDVWITLVPNTKIVRDIRMGDNGIFANAKKGCLIIDSSTISPTDTKEMSKIGEKLGFRIADVPISGGYMGAIAGTLTCIVGCRKTDYDEIHEVYSCMGKNIFYWGEPGAGQSAKICNNLGLAIQNISVAEALSLGEKLGVDLHILAKIMSLGTGMCWAVKVNTPLPGFDKSLPASNNYDHGFEVNLMKKDVSLVLDEAKKVDLDLQFAQKSYEYYKDAEDNGMGKKDISIMFQHLKHFTISKK